MATFPGFRIKNGSIIGIPDENQLIGTNRAQQLVTGIDAPVPPPVRGGVLTDNLPTNLWEVTLPGIRARSFFNDFYNSIHFIPANIELGAVSGDTSVVLSVWNAFLYPVTLEGISFINQGGIELDGPALPVELIPLQTITFNVRAGAEGPASIDTQVLFDFDVADYTVNVTGTRARLSPIIPNWSSNFEVEYQFKTDIFTSRNGKEQRRALRQTPRKNVSFTATPTHARLRAARNLLVGWSNNTIIMPEIPRQARLLEPLIDSNTILLREAAPDWLIAGETIVLSYKGLYETREVESVAGSTVVLRGVVSGMWPVGTKLHPGLAVRFADSINVRHLTSETATIGVELEVIPASEYYPATAVPVTFNGREAFLTAPNWADPVNDTFMAQREVVDYGKGRTAVFSPIPFGTVVQKMNYTGRSFAAGHALAEFFLRQKGQLGEFYMPTFVNDIPVVWTLAAGATTIRVYGPDFFRDLGDDTQRRAVAIYMKNGDVFLRKVDSVSAVVDELGSDSAVTLSEALPYDLTPSNVAKISWMPVWRFATDTFTMEWLTNSVAQCSMSVRMLEDIQ